MKYRGIDLKKITKVEEFKEHLKKKNLTEEKITKYISSMQNFQDFLDKVKASIDAFPVGKLQEYTTFLVSKNKEEVIDLILGLYNYAWFIKKFDYIEELIDIFESFEALETLKKRIGEIYGEKTANEIFKGITIPPLGVHPEEKPKVTKIVMKRLEQKLGVEITKDLLRPCLHGGPQPPQDKELFLKLKDLDEFLTRKHQDIVNEAIKHRNEKTAMFAQFVDDDVVEYIKNNPTIGFGIREGDKIILSKVPYQTMKFLTAKDKRLKRYYLCYCPWVRGEMKKGKEKEVSPNFCYCSGGYYKIYWEFIFDQPVVVEPLETALWGDLSCKFAVQIPKDIIDKYVKKK